MQDIFTISNIFLVVLVAFIGILVYLLRNVLLKVEKYEDILVNQTEFINQLSEIIKEGEQHLKNLDEKGVFQSDDEGGEFFNNMKRVQETINKFVPPQDYAKEEVQS